MDSSASSYSSWTELAMNRSRIDYFSLFRMPSRIIFTPKNTNYASQKSHAQYENGSHDDSDLS